MVVGKAAVVMLTGMLTVLKGVGALLHQLHKKLYERNVKHGKDVLYVSVCSVCLGTHYMETQHAYTHMSTSVFADAEHIRLSGKTTALAEASEVSEYIKSSQEDDYASKSLKCGRAPSAYEMSPLLLQKTFKINDLVHGYMS